METENNLKSILYMTVNTVNNKIYVGVHITETPYEFDGYYGDGITGTSCYWFKHPKYPFQRACKKYGLKSFRRFTLKVFESYDDALKAEAFIVDEEFLKRSDVYNVALGGGSGLVLSTEKPVYKYDLEGNFIEEYRSFSDAARKNKTKHPAIFAAVQNKGICKNFYWSETKFSKLNLTEFIKPIKPIYTYSLLGEFKEKFTSIAECSRKLDVKASSIKKAIDRGTKCCNLYFSFEKLDKFNVKKTKRVRHSGVHRYTLDGTYIDFLLYPEVKKVCGKEYCKLPDAIREHYSCAGYLWSFDKSDFIKGITKDGRKQIEQYDLEGNLVKVWSSYRECLKEFSNLRYVLNGSRTNTKGFFFKYKIEQN